MQAAKARLLHTEPAAGAVGLSMLLKRLQQQAGHVALHLRHINPHVASIFQVKPSMLTMPSYCASCSLSSEVPSVLMACSMPVPRPHSDMRHVLEARVRAHAHKL